MKSAPVDWSRVDWSKSSRQLAADLLCSYATVCRHRPASVAPVRAGRPAWICPDCHGTTRAQRADGKFRCLTCHPLKSPGRPRNLQTAAETPPAAPVFRKSPARRSVLVTPSGSAKSALL